MNVIGEYPDQNGSKTAYPDQAGPERRMISRHLRRSNKIIRLRDWLTFYR